MVAYEQNRINEITHNEKSGLENQCALPLLVSYPCLLLPRTTLGFL